MLTVIAFIVALGLLIAVHEYGHYRVAVACGVKVLRFSVGFGKTLLRWQPKNQKDGQSTEFVIGAFPLGGYIKMLDEREAPVAPHEKHLAFNTQPLRSRVAIVAAGPAANLLLAVVLYAGINWYGMQEPAAVLASPVAGSVAEAAGLKGKERVVRAAAGGDALSDVQSFEDLRWLLTRAVLNGQDVQLEVLVPGSSQVVQVALPLSRVNAREADSRMLREIGILGPWTLPVVGEIIDGGAAAKAGLRQGDRVMQIAQTQVVDGAQLRELIRRGVAKGQPAEAQWQIERDGVAKTITVKPEIQESPLGPVGRIGAYIGAPPEWVNVQHGFFEGLYNGVVKTWEVSALTLRMMGKMLVGEASLKNLSGPLTIADYAGKSASMGLTQYLLFVALISVSLGVLNLLPLPVLDGGHLMYYLWEGVTGKSPSEQWMERLQRGGVALLMVMMSIALFNDFTRLFG